MTVNIDSTNLPNSPISSAEVQQLLSEKVNGLLFPSESDRPIEVISLGKANDIKELIKVESNIPNQEVQDYMSFDDFYHKYGTQKEWQNSLQKNFADDFGLALQVVKENLSNVQILRIGQIEIALFIVGQSEDGEWQGLKTIVIETGE